MTETEKSDRRPARVSRQGFLRLSGPASVGWLLSACRKASTRQPSPIPQTPEASPVRPSPEAGGNGSLGTVFLSDQRLRTLRQRIADRVEPTFSAFWKIRQVAASRTNYQPHVPETWYVPGYYRDAQGHTTSKRGLQEDANLAYTFALHYRMTDEVRSAEAAARLIDAWAGLQNLRTEDDSKLSFSYHFPALILAADLIVGFDGWPAERQEAFRTFVRKKALPMNTMDRANNWGNWGLVLVLASAAWLGDATWFGRGVDRWEAFIEHQIAEDGHLAHEVHRNNGVGERGIWYTHFSLMPQTIAAEIARVNGVDLYDYVALNGRTLRQAYERVVPWARDPSTFPYFRGEDKSELKGTDYVSYFEILNPRWPNEDAMAMLAQRRSLTANHCTPHLTFTHGDLLHDDGTT
jgi:hypothetical protein